MHHIYAYWLLFALLSLLCFAANNPNEVGTCTCYKRISGGTKSLLGQATKDCCTSNIILADYSCSLEGDFSNEKEKFGECCNKNQGNDIECIDAASYSGY